MTDPVYAAVAARRLQWDGLLWQVPALSMTAQAFLMTIALGSDTSQTARILTSLLSMVAAFATLHLFASNRRSEVADAHLLEDHEKATNPEIVVHGETYRDRRNTEPMGAYSAVLVKVRAYTVWMAALTTFALASVVTLGFAMLCPGALAR